MFRRPIDLTIFGVLFLIGGPAELYNIIKTGWTYNPKFFGVQVTGFMSPVILMAQPVLHIAIGIGFLTLRKWAFYLSLFYAADVLTSSISSFILVGYGRIRTIFIAFLIPFVIYLIARRKYFVR